MKLTIFVALLAVAATHVAAVTPIPIPECTKTVIVKSTDTCNEMAEKPICVSVSPGGINPPREPKVHKAKKVVKAPKPKVQAASKPVAPAASKPEAPAASKPVAPAAHGPAKVSRIEGNPEIQVESEEPKPTIASSSSNAKGGSLHRTNAATTVGYATFSVVGATLVSLTLVL